MMRRKMTVIGALAILGVLTSAPVGTAQSGDPWLGTWRLNVAKSKYDPGPGPKSNTLKIEAVAGGAQKHTFDGVDAQGQTIHSERVTKFDGVDVPIQAVPPPKTTNTNAFRRTGERSFEVVNKVDGKPTTTARVEIAPDGKTLTQTTTGTNAQGRRVNNVIVYDKQ